MPSPLGHAIGGVASAWVVIGAPSLTTQRDRAIREAALFGALAMLPDVDLLVGGHRGPTHSVGAAVLVGLIAAVVCWWVPRHRESAHGASAGRAARFGAACMLAYGSHIPLDWLSHDNTAPIGIMALWPFSHEYYASQVQVFLAISRRYYHGWRFVMQNTLAVLRELVILLPAMALVIMMRPRVRSETRS
jgi:inner membrane protein